MPRAKAKNDHRIRERRRLRKLWKKGHKENVAEFVRAKKSGPCADCLVTYPFYVMHFDHRRGEKAFSISEAVSRRAPLVVIAAEIEKCDVVCANCHATRTYLNRDHLRTRAG